MRRPESWLNEAKQNGTYDENVLQAIEERVNGRGFDVTSFVAWVQDTAGTRAAQAIEEADGAGED